MTSALRTKNRPININKITANKTLTSAQYKL